MIRFHLAFSFIAYTYSCAITALASPPKLTRITPPGGQRGTTVEAYMYGRYLEDPQQLHFYEPGIKLVGGEALKGEVEINGKKEKIEPGMRIRVKLQIAAECPLGPHGVRLGPARACRTICGSPSGRSRWSTRRVELEAERNWAKRPRSCR